MRDFNDILQSRDILLTAMSILLPKVDYAFNALVPRQPEDVDPRQARENREKKLTIGICRNPSK